MENQDVQEVTLREWDDGVLHYHWVRRVNRAGKQVGRRLTRLQLSDRPPPSTLVKELVGLRDGVRDRTEWDAHQVAQEFEDWRTEIRCHETLDASAQLAQLYALDVLEALHSGATGDAYPAQYRPSLRQFVMDHFEPLIWEYEKKRALAITWHKGY